MQFFEKKFHCALPGLQNEIIFYLELNKCILDVIKNYFFIFSVVIDTSISFSKEPKTDLVRVS